MQNTLANTRQEIASEPLTSEELISIFKKSLRNKKDGAFPLYTEIEDALSTLISHMRAINPISANFIQSKLERHKEGLHTTNNETGDQFIGLQGFIRYIEKKIITPLENSSKNETQKIIAEIYKTQLEALSNNIEIQKGVIAILNKVKLDCNLLLENLTNPEDLAKIKAQKERIEDIIDETEHALQNSEALYVKISHQQE